MLKRLIGITAVLLLFVSWVTLQLPEAPDIHCQAAVNAPFIAGHDVLVTHTSDESLFWKKELLKSANHSIEFSMGFSGGPLLEETLLLLESALLQKPDLQIHLFISSCPYLAWGDHYKIEHMAESFPGRFHYLIRGMTVLRQGFGFVTSENHIKMLVIDETYMVVGGTNLFHSSRNEVPKDLKILGVVDYFNPKASVDMDLVVKGPLVSNMRREFFDLWALYESGASLRDEGQFAAEETRHFPIDLHAAGKVELFDTEARVVRDVPMKAIVSGPRHSPGACSAEYASLVNCAMHSLDLMHMYISPIDEVYSSLMGATSRGVKLTLVTNGAGDPVPIVTKTMGSYNMTHLLPLCLGKRYRLHERLEADAAPAADCHIYVYEAEDTLYHKKVMVVDDHLSVIGSYNLGHKSHYGDHEIMLEIESTVLAQQIKDIMQVDCSRARLCDRAEISDWYFSMGARALALIESALIFGPLY